MEVNGGKRKKRIWTDGDLLIEIAKREEENLEGRD